VKGWCPRPLDDGGSLTNYIVPNQTLMSSKTIYKQNIANNFIFGFYIRYASITDIFKFK